MILKANTFIFSILISLNSLSQMCFLPEIGRKINNLPIIDSANIKIIYTKNKKENEPDIYEDMQILEIGRKISKYYSYNVFQVDSLYTNFLEKNPKAGSIPRYVKLGNEWKYLWSECYKDHSTNMYTEYAFMPDKIPNYKYTEEIPHFEWVFHEDTMTVASYLCQKASCWFRGRIYYAWFCEDIPVNNGPWKFGGLPGLILKVYDDNMDYIFECTGIKTSQTGFPITSYDYSSYGTIKREDLIKLWANIFKDYFKVAIGKSSKLFQSIPYNPLELE